MSLKASVVIPTCNRPAGLKNLLLSLSEQTCPSTDFEILVVDNGDSTATKGVIESIPMSLQLVYRVESAQSAAKARNRGVRKATADLIIFVDDDATVEPNFVKEHIAAHAARQEGAIILGKIIQKPIRPGKITSMYLSQSIQQFKPIPEDYCGELGYECFYTINLSLPRSVFLNAGGFDENFPFAGWEDIDLGYRLSKTGVKLFYHPQAVVFHHFDASFKSFVKGRYQRGRSLGYLLDKHPELRQEVHIANLSFFIIVLKFVGALVAAPFGLLVFAFTRKLLFRSLDAIGNVLLFLGLRSFGKKE